MGWDKDTTFCHNTNSHALEQTLPTERFTLDTCYHQEEGPPTVLERTNWLSRVSACTAMQNIRERRGVLKEGRGGTTTI